MPNLLSRVSRVSENRVVTIDPRHLSLIVFDASTDDRLKYFPEVRERCKTGLIRRHLYKQRTCKLPSASHCSSQHEFEDDAEHLWHMAPSYH